MIDVVTIYTPRPSHEKYIDFEPLIKLQKATAEKWGHRHFVVSDRPLKDVTVIQAELPVALMHAIMRAQVEYVEHHWQGNPGVMVDVDCLIARPLNDAFLLPFDLGLTNREDHKAPINNGAMYLGGNQSKVAEFFRLAETFVHPKWGGDQEAISRAAAPVPSDHRIEARDGLRLAFLDMRRYNCIPREIGLRHKKNPFIVHFKGDERKPWMETYARNFIL